MSDSLSIGVSGLKAFQQALTTVSHNVSNANTEGYSRQVVSFSTGTATLVDGRWVGSGVRGTGPTRQYETFLAEQVTTGYTTTEELGAYLNYSTMLDDLYADPNVGAIPVIQDFFDAMQSVSSDSGSAASRQLLLSNADSMVARFDQLNQRSNQIRAQVNDALDSSVSELQQIADSLAVVNQAIVVAKTQTGTFPPDMLDQRDNLVNQAAKLTSVKTVEQEDGSLNLFIGRGQALVVGGDAATISTRNSTSDPSSREVVLTPFGSSTPQAISSFMSGGRIGGLIDFSSEVLNPAQDQLGLTAIGIIDAINTQHQKGIDLYGALGTEFFSMPEPEAIPRSDNSGTGAVAAAFVDVGNLTGDEYRLSKTATANEYQLLRLSDNATTTITSAGGLTGELSINGVAQGFELNITAGAVSGDSFLIRPTRNGAQDVSVLVQDVNNIAAAGAARSGAATDANGNPTNTGNGRITQPSLVTPNGSAMTAWADIGLTFDSALNQFTVTGATPATLAYNPATEGNGKSFTLASTVGDITFSLSGTPANGDQFLIEDNAAGVADNSNAVLMEELQNATTMLKGATTFQGTFSKMVADVGTRTRHAQMASEAQSGLLEQAKAAHADVSGVNLDEEAANLMRYTQAYQAAAQVIAMAQSTFDTLLSAVRGG